MDPAEALALFIYGCSPGGSGSNNWTILFDGDIDLSAIMTFVSTMGSLVMMPLWMYTLGTTITDSTRITIPFSRLVLNLLSTVIPCLIGLVLTYYFPKLKVFFIKITKPVVIVLITSFLVITFITRYFILELITWQQWVAGPLIPWSGFLIGAFASWLMRLPKKVTV